MKITTVIILLLILLAGGVLAARFLLGGDEDTWICDNGQWVKHGNPSASMPTTPCKGVPIVITPQSEQGAVHDQAKFETSKQLAEAAVKSSPTYKFDGSDLQFVSSAELPCANCWDFTFSFSSRSAGYGNRQGQILAQVISPHQIRATVQNEKVTVLITDQTFDELHQMFLK